MHQLLLYARPVTHNKSWTVCLSVRKAHCTGWDSWDHRTLDPLPGATGGSLPLLVIFLGCSVAAVLSPVSWLWLDHCNTWNWYLLYFWLSRHLQSDHDVPLIVVSAQATQGIYWWTFCTIHHPQASVIVEHWSGFFKNQLKTISDPTSITSS